MKKITSTVMSLAMAASLAACSNGSSSAAAPAAAGNGNITDGEYKVTCNGFYGDFDVTVTVAEGKIAKVEAGENAETPTLGGIAIEKLSADIVDKQTCAVDGVSGATITTFAFRAAVKQALKDAGASDEFYEAAEYASETFEYDTDILVIGAGAGGYAAAVTAAQAGANVILIEKQDVVGGSCITSAGIVYAALSEDDIPGMENYYMERAEGKGDSEIINTYCENTLDTKAWLEANGVEWMFAAPSGTAPEPRANFAMGITGASLIEPLEKAGAEAGMMTITDCAATELVTDESGKVVGAKASGKHAQYTFTAKAVVLATGGFDADEDLKRKWSPIAFGDYPLSSKGNTGDGIKMGMEVGAATEFKQGIIGFMFCNAALPGSGNSNAVLTAPAYIDNTGSYVAPGIDYPINYTALKAYEADHDVEQFYALWDANGEASAQSAVDQGHGFRADTVAELAAAIGADESKLQDAFAAAGLNTEAGPLFAIEAECCTIGSMGGLVINTKAEVLNEEGNAIEGLYAAGEVCNAGLYYIEYPASGTSNSASFTYGRIAAASALEYIK